MIHLKTNYFGLDEARRQAEILEHAVRHLG